MGQETWPRIVSLTTVGQGGVMRGLLILPVENISVFEWWLRLAEILTRNPC